MDLLEYGAGLAGLVLVTMNPAEQAAELENVRADVAQRGPVPMASSRGNPMTGRVEGLRPALADRRVVSFADWAEFVATAKPTPLHRQPGDACRSSTPPAPPASPKGVLLHHRGLVNNAHLSMARMAVTAGDGAWPMPLFHTAGCGLGVLGAASVGATLVLLAQFKPARRALIKSKQATHRGSVPTMLIAMLDHQARGGVWLRVVCTGGGPVPAELAREWERRLGAPFSIMFGTTECSPIISFTRLDDSPEIRTGTLGTPMPARRGEDGRRGERGGPSPSARWASSAPAATW